MLSLLIWSFNPRMARDNLGVGGQPATPTLAQLKSTSTAINSYAQKQQQGPVAEPAKEEVSHDLLDLSAGKNLSSSEVAQVQAIQAKVSAGQQLTPDDIKQITAIVDRLEAQIQAQTPPKTPQESQQHMDEGLARHKKGDFPGAEAEFRKALATCPLDDGEHLANRHINIGMTLEAQGKKEEAIQEYNSALRANPGGPDAASIRQQISKLGGKEADPVPPAVLPSQRHLDTGFSLYQGKDYAAAEVAFRRALSTCPPDDTRRLASRHFDLGMTLAAQGKTAEALHEYNSFLRDDPSSPDAEAVRKEITRLGGKVDDPIPATLQASKRHLDVGLSLYSGKDYPGAEAAFRRAVDTCPPSDTVHLASRHFNLGMALQAQGKKAEAVKEYNQYLQLNPNSPDDAAVRAEIVKLGGEPVPKVAPDPLPPLPKGQAWA